MLVNDARASIYGTVIADPRISDTRSGQVLNMKVGVSTRKESKQNPKYSESDIYDVAVFGNMGGSLAKFVKKGTMVWVDGEMMMGVPWTDKNNVTHVSPQITASHVKLMPRYTSNNNNQQPADEDAPF